MSGFTGLTDRLMEHAHEVYSEAAADMVEGVQAELIASAPRASGAFAASFKAWVGSPAGVTFEKSDTQPDPTRAVIARVKPGEAFGLASAAPYGAGLAYQGRSKKVHRAWYVGAVRSGLNNAKGSR